MWYLQIAACASTEVATFLDFQEILNNLYDGSFRVEKGESRRVIDIDTISSAMQEKFFAKRAFIRDIDRTYGPTFLGLSGHGRKDEFNLILEKYNFSRCTAWRYVRAYLQSGMDEYSLFPKPTGSSTGAPYNYSEKTGRKQNSLQTGILIDNSARKHFEEALQYYKSGRANTMKNAFDRMNLKHYMTTEIK